MSSQTISGLFTLLTPVTLARLVLLSDPWLLDMVCSLHIFHTVCDFILQNHLDVGEYWLSLLQSWRWFIAFNCVSMDQVAMVAIGATMVGSINLSKKEGDTIKKGEQVGICCLYFAIKCLCKSLPSSSPLQGKNVPKCCSFSWGPVHLHLSKENATYNWPSINAYAITGILITLLCLTGPTLVGVLMSGGFVVQMGYFQFGGSTVIVVFQQVSPESLHFICSVWLASHVVRIVCVYWQWMLV